MKTTFATAVLLGLVAARPEGTRPKGSRPQNGNGVGSKGANARFGKYGAKFNKQYVDTADFEKRRDIYNKIIAEIDRVNSLARGPDDLRLAENIFADMTPEEFSKWTGLRVDPEADTRGFGKRNDSQGGRKLGHAATAVDHHKDGFMHPVKDQGGCGSCWAFAANTALEGTIAKKTNSTPVRISEQQLVDCLYDNKGCNGGWMSTAWRFQERQGYMYDSDYPYVSGTTGRET